MNIRNIMPGNSIGATHPLAQAAQNSRNITADMPQPSNQNHFAASPVGAKSAGQTRSVEASPGKQCEMWSAFRFKLKVAQGFPLTCEVAEYEPSAISDLDELFMDAIEKHNTDLARQREQKANDYEYDRVKRFYEENSLTPRRKAATLT